MTEEKEPFLARWSRLKIESREEAPPAPAPLPREEEPLPELPKVEELTPDSDFKPFMDPRVDGETRRTALKKLFADARFNVPDPFEAYSEDYTKAESIPVEMLKTLNQARKLLMEEPEKIAQAPEAPEPEPTVDDAGRQDA
jgi:hypothetical protein